LEADLVSFAKMAKKGKKQSIHRTDDPESRGELNGCDTRVLVGEETGRESSNERSKRHGTSDTTLLRLARAMTSEARGQRSTCL
jgi:hypothetical protein